MKHTNRDLLPRAFVSGIAASEFRPGVTVFFFATLIATSAAVFALRGLCYAMLEAGRVPFGDTGSAVGIVSVVGYTPDVLMGALMGTCWIVGRVNSDINTSSPY